MKNIYKKNYGNTGISCDIPIILVRIRDVNDCDIVEQLLKAKEYFNVKNIMAYLVILNEEKNIYEQYVKEKIQAEILNKHLEYLLINIMEYLY